MNFCIVQIKENVALLSDDFRQNKLGVRLSRFIDFRNLLVHEYGKTDYSAYRDLIETDVPKLKASLETFLSR